jgi:hypothetical protein
MAIAKWNTPSARSANFAGTTLNSLANGSESTQVDYDNSSDLDLYGAITLLLGSLTPSSGGSVTVRVNASDGTSTPDRAGGDTYTVRPTSGASAKVVIFPMVRLYPFGMKISVTNNLGVSLNASNNALHVTPYNEEVS